MGRFKLWFGKKSSRDIAKDRLKILLISDRANCSPETMEMIKNDIARVISKYMKIDAKSMEIQIKKQGCKGRSMSPALYASIPIIDIGVDDVKTVQNQRL
ncbi:MAG: cell division topological specificity factor MinE [Lachnospiraceae bacterium]|nr:cell division topological specificity factor MinE [Lachnospiraceae bacterium]